MKFETPKMEIAVFSTEDVVTTSVIETSATVNEAKTTLQNAGIAEANTALFTFTF